MTTVKCRMLVCSQDDAPDRLSESDNPDLLPLILDKQYPFEGCHDCVFEHRYDAPLGWEYIVGAGVLFENQWCNDDIYTLCQVWDDLRKEWVDPSGPPR